jgi:hypothetical protein
MRSVVAPTAGRNGDQRGQQDKRRADAMGRTD